MKSIANCWAVAAGFFTTFPISDAGRRFTSQPVERVGELINPILRGWVNYFAVGHSSRCFSFVKDWVEKKFRRHLMRARKRKGFGWKRWNRRTNSDCSRTIGFDGRRWR
ncbi:MAG: hypothetical protein JNL98_30455 [Bryobacterales bacterium]|nr:hypothetical protein [Bryobacterales bacterium]